jgi:hypothetical protein
LLRSQKRYSPHEESDTRNRLEASHGLPAQARQHHDSVGPVGHGVRGRSTADGLYLDPAGERLARIDALAVDYGTTPPPRALLVGVFEEPIVRREIGRARSTVERLASYYGETSEVATFRERLKVAAEDPLEGPTLEELRATSKATAEQLMPYVGTWSGSTRDEGSTTEKPLTLRLRLEAGVVAGDFTFPDGARHTLDYIALVDEELHVGYMNQMHPRGMLMYEGVVSGDVFEGKFVLRGVVFKLPNGKTIPASRFHLTREHSK